jgi:hypothetical protein
VDDKRDPFSIENLRSPELEAAEAALRADIAARRGGGNKPKWLADKIASTSTGVRAVRKKPRDRSKYFVRFPMVWVEALAKIHAGSHTYRVALGLVFEAWDREGGQEVKFTNELAEKFGVSRKGKASALRQLKKAGLVSVRGMGRKSPRVTLRFTDGV